MHIFLKDGKIVDERTVRELKIFWRNITKMSESSADALKAIVELVAHANGKLPVETDKAFCQESKDILVGFRVWPLGEAELAIIENAVVLENGLYVWINPLWREACSA